MTVKASAGLQRIATAVALGIVATIQWSFARTMRNDAFVDEATYISAGRMLHAAATSASAADALPAFATYFSGAPHLYPILAAYADRTAGLEGARMVSYACIVVALLAVYVATLHLFRDRLAGVVAAALFAAQAPVLFLSRQATFDAPCVALLSVAVAACAVASSRRHPSAALIACAVAGGCIGAAAAIKYASLLYVPCVVALAMCLSPHRRLWSGLVTAAAAFAIAALLLSTGSPHDLATGFLATTLNRGVVSGGRAVDILAFAAQLGGLVGLLALPVFLIRSAVPRRVTATLCLFALAAPLNHARLHEFVSLHKHIAFSLVLLAPLAGGALAIGARWVREEFEHGSAVTALTIASIVGVLIVRLNVGPAAQHARALYAYWPNATRQAYLALAPIASADARILSEEPDLGWYYIGPKMPYANWTHPYYFRYQGKVATTVTDSLSRVALRDGYFDAIVLRYGPQRAWARAVEHELLGLQPAYRLARQLPYELSDGPGRYELWVRSDAPGAEAVR